MEKGTKLEVTVDLENYTVNIKNIPGMQTCHAVIRNSEGRLLLLGENIPVKEGEITWIKLFDLDPNPDNGFHQEDFRAFVFAINQDGAEIAEGISEPFHLNEGQVQFIKDTYTANHPKVTSVEQPATSIITVTEKIVSETISIKTERPAGGDLGIHIPEPAQTSPLSQHVEEAEGGVGGDTDEARNIQASPEIPPAPAHTNTEGEEKNLTDATPATEVVMADQPQTPPVAQVTSTPTPSPEEVAAYALEQMQKQLKEKEEAHAKELERVKAEKDAELKRLQKEQEQDARTVTEFGKEITRLKNARTKQAEELQRAEALAEQKLAEERATHQQVEREQRQWQEQEQAANAERQRLHEEEMQNLRRQVAALASAQQAQATNPAPAAAATQTTTATTPAPTPQPAQAANQTPTPPIAAVGAPATETDDEPEEVPHARRFVWNGLHTTILVIILATVAALLILSSNFAPSSEKLADTGDEAEIIRLQEEANRTKIKAVADSQKSAAATVPTPVVLDAEEKAFTGKGGDLSLAPSSIRDGARASVNMLNNSKFGDNARIEVNNKIDIHDNRQDNRQFYLDPDRWTKEWNPTLPWIEASELPCGYSTILIPRRGVQGIRLTPEYDVEVCSYDMPDIDVKIGTAIHGYTYKVGPDGEKVKASQMRICPKPHQSDVLVEILMIPPGGCKHPGRHPRQK